MKSKIYLNSLKRGSLSLALALLLTACGGGSGGGESFSEDIPADSDTPVEPVTPAEPDTSADPVTPTIEDMNHAPTLSISTKNSSVFEGMSVELNATATDSDNDTLTYGWTQKSGPSVSLINGTTAKPSFIAPNVSTDSNVSFELEVSDGKVTTATKATVSVNIVDVPKVSKYHEVMPSTTAVSMSSDTVTISYNYNKNPISEITSGLVLNVYWDDSKLEYNNVLALLNKDYIGVSSLKEDSSNGDSDVSTNKYISIAWVNLANGNWEVPSTLPTALFSITMKSKAAQTGISTLNIKMDVASPGLEFYSQSVLVDLGN